MERRRLPRYAAWVSCSVSVHSAGGEAAPKRIIGHTHDLNREALSIILPSNQTYGIDPASIGSGAEVTVALPNGYLTLQCSLLRHEPRAPEGNLVVFLINQPSAQYLEYLESVIKEADRR